MATRQKIEGKVYEPAEWETVPCPICGMSQPIVHERFGDRWQYTHNICSCCGIVYCSPRPKYDANFIEDAYSCYNADSKAFSKGFNQKELDGLISLYGNEVRHIASFCRNPSAFLDVGSDLGQYLYVASKFFDKVYGLDISISSAQAVERMFGFEVFPNDFLELKTEKKFPCIHMSHVLEHTPDPHCWLRKAKDMLTPDGILVVKVPHIFSPDRKIKVFLKKIGFRKGKWEPWRTPDHLWEGSFPGMHRLFALNGFTVLAESTYSKKSPAASSPLGRLYHGLLQWGNNIRFIVKPIG